ncbi:MAG: sulfite exporter TauE/SafE family protein [Nitrospirae bacterium]|nr:sulfite exporter TauE/SafE family protein [Nitrospirota bacterium]
MSTSIQQGERILSIALIAHVALYSVMPAKAGLSTSPDWMLGIRFGVGGFAGMYLGARCQKFMPQKFIKLMLTTIITFLALKYIVQYFR